MPLDGRQVTFFNGVTYQLGLSGPVPRAAGADYMMGQLRWVRPGQDEDLKEPDENVGQL